MTETVQKRAVKNTLVGLLSFVISLLSAFITVPILLSKWGNETYGVWLALFAGYTMLQSLDNGHINYVGNKLNVLYHKDILASQKVLGSSLLISFILGSVQLLIAFVLIFTNKLKVVFGINVLAAQSATLNTGLIILLLVWIIFGSFGGILHRLMIPVGLMYQSQWWGILYSFTQLLSIIITVISGGSILDVCIVYALVQAFVYTLTFIYIKNKIPLFFPWWKLKDWKTAFSNFGKSLVLTINNIIQQLGNSGLILFIANLFSVATIPVFTTLRTITNSAGSITNVFITSLVPDLVRYHANGEGRKVLATQNANWFITGSIINLGILIIMPFIEALYVLWTKGHLGFNFQLFLFLVASISFLSFGTGLNTYIKSINDLFSQTVIIFTRVILIFLFSYLFITSLGIASVGLGILISELVSSVILPVYFVNKIINTFSVKFNIQLILLLLLPSVLLTGISLIYLAGFEKIIILSSVALLSDLIIYLLIWFRLDIELKDMMKYTFQNMFTKN